MKAHNVYLVDIVWVVLLPFANKQKIKLQSIQLRTFSDQMKFYYKTVNHLLCINHSILLKQHSLTDRARDRLQFQLIRLTDNLKLSSKNDYDCLFDVFAQQEFMCLLYSNEQRNMLLKFSDELYGCLFFHSLRMYGRCINMWLNKNMKICTSSYLYSVNVVAFFKWCSLDIHFIC